MFQPRYVGFTLDVTVIDQDFESDGMGCTLHYIYLLMVHLSIQEAPSHMP